MNDGSDALTPMHQFEGLIDVVQFHGVGNEAVQGDVSFLITLDIARELASAPDSPEGRTPPNTTGDQLKRSRADFLACPCNADDCRFTPPLVTRLKGSTHDIDVANAFEGIINTSIGDVDQNLLDRF